MKVENHVASHSDTLAEYNFVYVKAKLSCAGYRVFLKDSLKILTETKTCLTTSQSVCKAQFFNLAHFSFYHKNTDVDCFERKKHIKMVQITACTFVLQGRS